MYRSKANPTEFGVPVPLAAQSFYKSTLKVRLCIYTPGTKNGIVGLKATSLQKIASKLANFCVT